MTVYNDVLNTLLVANGIYIAGTTAQEFDANAASVYNDFSAYYTLQNNVSQAELEAILASSYSNGNVNLSSLDLAGIADSLPTFAASLISNGVAEIGSNSLSSGTNIEGSLVVNGVSYPVAMNILGSDHISEEPKIQEHLAAGRKLVAYKINVDYGSYKSIKYFFADEPFVLSINNNALLANNVPYVIRNVNNDGTLTGGSITVGEEFAMWCYSDSSGVILNGNASITISGTNTGINVTDRTAAVIANGVTAGTFPAVNGTVPVFSPTAGQLQSGYNYTVLIDSGSISGKILTTDNMLEALQAYDANLMSVIDAKIDAALGAILNASY